MSDRRALVARNSAANVIRATASSAVGIVLPLALLALLRPEAFAAWALVYSMAGYVAFFDLGMPATVQSLVARSNEQGAPAQVRRAALSGVKITLGVGVVFSAGSFAVAGVLRFVSPEMDASLFASAGLSLVILTVGQSSNLLANTVASYFAGLQRNIVPTAVVAPARLLSLLCPAVAAYVTGDLVLSAIAFAVPCCLSCMVLLGLFFWETKGSADRTLTYAASLSVHALLRFAGPMILWSFTMLAATGLGTLIVSRYAYEDLVAFAIGQVVYSGVYGLSSAIGSPLLPELSRTSVTDPLRMGAKVILATRVYSAVVYGMAGLATAALPAYLAVAGANLVSSAQVWGVSLALLIAAATHLALSPLSMGLIAMTRHAHMTSSAIWQAVVTVALSLALVQVLGGMGVAVGYAVGSIVGVLVACFWAAPRSSVPGLSGRPLARWVLWVPVVGLAAPFTLVVWGASDAVAPASPAGAAVAVVALALALGWQYGVTLPQAERHRVLAVLRPGSSRNR